MPNYDTTESLMKKIEEDEEIRALIDEIFENATVSEALKRFSSDLASHLQLYREENIFTEEEMKTLVNEYFWIRKFKASFYVALIRDAILKLFEKEGSGWDVKEEVINILKETVTPELVIASIEAFEAKRLEEIAGVLILSSVVEFLSDNEEDE